MMFCRFFRFMISIAADGDGELAGLTQRHVLRCAGCRDFHEICQSLGCGLRRDGAKPEVATGMPEALGGRIMEAVAARKLEGYKLRIRFRVAAVAASVALILLGGALFLAAQRNAQGPGRLDQGSISDVLGRLAVDDASAEWSQVVETALAGEIRNLTYDAESAAEFLVACVAVDPTSSQIQGNR
jgi:hypothetical protein